MHCIAVMKVGVLILGKEMDVHTLEVSLVLIREQETVAQES